MSLHINYLNKYIIKSISLLPGTLTTYKETANATIMQKWLNDIRVGGGGDCPEYSMTGLVKGIHSIRKVKVHILQTIKCNCISL